MTAKELMINDWAYSDVLNKPCQVGRPSDFRFMYTKAYDVFDENGEFIHLHPIPLTEEILEKNGFDIVQDGDSLTIWKQKDDEYGNEVYDITIYASKGVMRLDISIRYHGTIKKNICYVHELQRALRCVGLWDLANNFKVI